MHGITKIFGSFCALDHMDLDVKAGTLHSLLGENGAGKSTLMNVLYRLYQAEEGEIYLNGRKVEIKSPSDAIRLGIGMVHQHFMLVERFTVLQNIILGDETVSRLGMLDMKRARKDVMEIANKLPAWPKPGAWAMPKVHQASAKKMEICFNPSPMDAQLQSFDYSVVSMLLLNEVEGRQITGERETEKILDILEKRFASMKIVLTLGSEGRYFHMAGQDAIRLCFQWKLSIRPLREIPLLDILYPNFIVIEKLAAH